jgi:Arc/MetJ-type ribon-helix-helix transcriptional regulator
MTEKKKGDPLGDIFSRVKEKLERAGVELESIFGEDGIDLSGLVCCDDLGDPLRVVCVKTNVGDVLDEMGKAKRDQVVMVRVDAETAEQLDAWVETGAVKSRSEAAALFIREGLKVRSGELNDLEDAIQKVDEAKQKLRERVREVLGTDDREGDAEEVTEEE